MTNINWIFQTSSLDALKIGEDERRFFVPTKTGKTIIPDYKKFKEYITDLSVEIKNDRR